MIVRLALLISHLLAPQPQTPARSVSAPPMSLRVIASSGELMGNNLAGTRVTGVIDGQPLVLHSRKETNPLTPGTYPVKLSHNAKPHGAELDQQYTVTLPDGRECLFYLEAICERGTTICYGVSIN